MRSRSLATQHDAAVARRLELLRSELAAARDHASRPDDATPSASWRPVPPAHLRPVPDLEEPDTLDVEAEVVVPIEPLSTTMPVPSVARLPGRHASRRRATAWAELVPEGLRGRILLGPGQVAVVAILMVAGLGLTCWWLLRSGGHEQSAPLTVSTPRAGLATPDPSSVLVAPSSGVSSAAGSTPAKVVVDVTGQVRHSGIVVLHQGARVVDALRAAGGARPGVDLGGLNLARVLSDGEQVVVGGAPAAAPMGAPSAGGSGAVPPPGAALVDLNTADETTLESLPEVGPVTAAAIIAWRTQHGGFSAVDQLLDVDGIGDATLARLTPYVTI